MKRLINLRPDTEGKFVLGILPFLLLLIVYYFASDARLAINPNDKLLPGFSQFGEAIWRVAFEADKRTGGYLLWDDTWASILRLGSGILLAALLGLVVGVLNGTIPLVKAVFSPILIFISLIPPLAILPILLILLGLGEISKVSLIIIGTAPFIARDLQSKTAEISYEQLVKAQTLGANTAQIIFRVILPQVLPKLITSVRLSLGSGWLFLIAAESIAATEGLGYRIFLVRRYMSMDVILPYVLWITLLAFVIDFVLNAINRKLFPWQKEGK
ncbi:MAG TPA: lipid kinase [Pasteurellaceae bacterium]|nr:lipid kinase [Pasteurellaceae bacterium]